MSKEKSKKVRFSKISLRTAIPGGLGCAISTAALFIVFADLPTQTLLLATLISFLISAFIIYTISNKLHQSRVKTLEEISKNISRKRFSDYDDIELNQRDELDYLIAQSVRSSRKIEKELQRMNKIENYRKEFIGDISHELKTPIFAIQGFIETLLNGALEDEEVNKLFLKKAMRNVNRLTYLTKDLMEISRLETGELKSNLQDIYLRDLILDVVESLQYKSEKEDVEIRVTDFDKNLQVRADRNQIKQVLINLIENGIKYNRAGGNVEIGIKKFKKDRDRIIVYTKDTGIGIEEKDIPRVTERFFRVDKSRSREKGGTGLGLSIVKHIIEAHGEFLFIESSKKGTMFSFTLSKVNHVFV